MTRVSKIDWDIIDARVRSIFSKHRTPNLSTALLWLVLEQYFPDSAEDRIEDITDGGDDRGVDAIHIIEGDDFCEIYLFQSKYRETHSATDKTINDSECLKITLFMEELFEKSDHLRSCGNLRLKESIDRIWSFHEKGTICRYHIVFCSNDQGLSNSAMGILENLKAKYLQISVESYGPSDLIRDFASHGVVRETGYLQVIGREVFERTDGDVRGVIASVDANSFVDLIRIPNSSTVKRYLFDDNLRVFLGSNGGYNSSIITTATSTDSHLFWYLNNGITITCKNYSYNKGHISPKIKIEEFQIVNGAQTSHSLIEASRIEPKALENVVIMVRVYATDRSDIAERVAVATNSQARIQGRDLRANHPILKKLELAFAERGYYFERKRNMHADHESELRIDALKLGQIIMSYYLGDPDRARADSNSIFENRFPQIYHEGYDVDELCRVFRVYSKIEKMREDYLHDHSGGIESGGEYQYLVYGHWFILYAINIILAKSIKSVPSEEGGIESAIVEAIGLVARACSQQKAVAQYQMFRSPRTKEKIYAELNGKQGNLFDALNLQ